MRYLIFFGILVFGFTALSANAMGIWSCGDAEERAQIVFSLGVDTKGTYFVSILNNDDFYCIPDKARSKAFCTVHYNMDSGYTAHLDVNSRKATIRPFSLSGEGPETVLFCEPN